MMADALAAASRRLARQGARERLHRRRRLAHRAIAELRRWRPSASNPGEGRMAGWLNLTARRRCIRQEAELRRHWRGYRAAQAALRAAAEPSPFYAMPRWAA